MAARVGTERLLSYRLRLKKEACRIYLSWKMFPDFYKQHGNDSLFFNQRLLQQEKWHLSARLMILNDSFSVASA